MDIKLVKATDKDWEIIVDIEKTQIGNKLYSGFSTAEEAKEYLNGCYIYFIHADGQLAGYIVYGINDNVADLAGLVILPEFQGKKIATMALDEVLSEIETLGIKKVKLVTHPENTAAIILYLKKGFKINGWLENEFGDNEPRISLHKELV